MIGFSPSCIRRSPFSVYADPSNSSILNNILFSNFQPGKWIKSIEFRNFTTSTNFSNNGPIHSDKSLYLLMTHSTNVRHVTLPEFMDDTSCEQEWAYFSAALVNTNTWTLHTLSMESDSTTICGDTARRAYFHCVEHLRHSIRSLILTEGMINATGYKCLQKFERLSSLTVRGENVANSLADCCEIIDNLPNLEGLTIYFVEPGDDSAFSNDEDSSASSDDDEENTMQEVEGTILPDTAEESTLEIGTTMPADENAMEGIEEATFINTAEDTTLAITNTMSANENATQAVEEETTLIDTVEESTLAIETTMPAIKATTVNTYPKIKKLYFEDYCPSSIDQENDILFIKRFCQLNYLCIQDLDATPATFRKIMVDNRILAYIHQNIPC